MALYKTGTPVVDNLTSDETKDALSAKQGKILKDNQDNGTFTVTENTTFNINGVSFKISIE